MIVRALISLVFCCLAAPVWAGEVVIFAASSLKTALDEVTEGLPARISYGGSGLLARQILQGAPADIFFSANTVWMDAVEQGGGLARDTRRDLLANSLVIVSRDPVSLDQMLGDTGRVAIGLTNSVPAGIYAKAYLQAEGHWDAVASRLVETDSVRAALALVARGEVPYGVVYTSDVAADPSVQVVHALPDLAELPIRYPVALTARAGPEAAAVLAHLQSDAARVIFAAHGFGAP